MNTQKAAAQVYKDFEKLFRLLGFYKNQPAQLEQHLQFVDSRLEKYLRSDAENQFLEFNMLMTAVYCDSQEIYRSTNLEASLSYALFCEGVRSVVIFRDVSAKELCAWCLLIRQFLEKSDAENADLGSLLWRSPFSNIRTHFFSGLSNQGGEGDQNLEDIVRQRKTKRDRDAQIDSLLAFEQANAAEHTRDINDSTQLRPMDFHSRDQAWDTPSGDTLFRKVDVDSSMDDDDMKKLKQELGDAAISDRVKGIVRFSNGELDALEQEFDSLDQAHVDFNRLAQSFRVMKGLERSQAVSASSEEIISKIIETSVQHFHGGLLVYILKNLDEMKAKSASQAFVERARQRISQELKSEKGQSQIVEALKNPARIKLAKQLLNLIEMNDLPLFFDRLMASESSSGALALLEIIVARSPDPASNFLSWGDARQALLLPLLSKLSWRGASAYRAKLFKSGSLKLHQALAPYIAWVDISLQDASRIFSRLPSAIKNQWAESLSASEVNRSWIPFVQWMLTSSEWAKLDDNGTVQWLRVIFHYFGPQSFEHLLPLVESRKFFLWPKFPKEREAILTVAARMRGKEWDAHFKNVAAKESGVLFQAQELKERLKTRL